LGRIRSQATPLTTRRRKSIRCVAAPILTITPGDGRHPVSVLLSALSWTGSIPWPELVHGIRETDFVRAGYSKSPAMFPRSPPKTDGNGSPA
jgi:hypothetical protein